MTGVIPRNSAGNSARVICVGDPQYAVTNQPPLFAKQVDFIVRNPPDLVVIMGDCTDDGSEASWSVFAQQIAKLTAAGIAWMLILGNHDYASTVGAPGVNPSRTTRLNDYVPASPGIVCKDAGHAENAYRLIEMGGRECLVLCLEWSPRDATVAWANAVLDAQAGKPAIVVTHAYLFGDGTRFDQVAYGTEGQLGSPHSASMLTTPNEGIHDGQELWDALISQHSDVVLVMSGHVDVAARRVDVREDGTRCLQVLTDYQSEPWYGGGWLTEYDLDFANRIATARTVSPHFRYSRTVRANAFREAI
jgi:hypothetical protein